MCRGSNLGVCCAQDCDEQIRCQDSGGYCDEHDPLGYSWDDDAAEVPIAVVDDPEKRRAYTLSRLTVGISRAEATIRAEQIRLADLHSRVRDLANPKVGT